MNIALQPTSYETWENKYQLKVRARLDVWVLQVKMKYSTPVERSSHGGDN